MTELVTIPFHGTDLLAVEVDGTPHVVIRPALEALGLDVSAQMKKLRSRSWACMAVTTMQLPGETQRRDVTVVDEQTFIMLLATIDERRVAESKRPLLVAFQREVATVLHQYFTQGGAINPRASEDQLDVLTRRAQSQMALIASAKGIVDDHYLSIKAKHVLATAMGEEPAVEYEDRPLDVQTYLEEQGIRAELIRKYRSQFGKRLKATHVAERGCEPKKVDRFVNGTYQQVNGYTRRDAPLFAAVMSRMAVELELQAVAA